MREIKFRGREQETKKLVYGHFAREGGFDYIVPEKGFKYKIQIVWDGAEQFTGLTDRLGKEIYEGDIIRILYTDWGSKHLGTKEQQEMTLEEYLKSISSIGVVKFYTNRSKYEIDFGNYSDSLFEGTHGEKEIIGNIYESPEPQTDQILKLFPGSYLTKD